MQIQKEDKDIKMKSNGMKDNHLGRGMGVISLSFPWPAWVWWETSFVLKIVIYILLISSTSPQVVPIHHLFG